MTSDILFSEVAIGEVTTRNRIIRAGTAETMADAQGGVTDQLLEFYSALAAGSVGAIITGHMFVTARGRAAAWQLGIHDDDMVAGLGALADAIHAFAVPVFAQLSHAGSQSRMATVRPLGPSPVPNPLTGRLPDEATERDIEATIEAFAEAARRATRAGFDGIHLHGANGYLISEFSSPVTNQRTDGWGGSAGRRDRFATSVVEAVRQAVPLGYPVMFKIGMADSVPGGLTFEQSLNRAVKIQGAAVDGFEVSCGLMSRPSDSAATFVGLRPAQAIRDLLWPAASLRSPSEATFRDASRFLKQGTGLPVILTGGLRTTGTMREVLASGDADLVGLSRPLIRQPGLVKAISDGSAEVAACTSCNLCLQHSGSHPLQCWRSPKRRLIAHSLGRLRSRPGR